MNGRLNISRTRIENWLGTLQGKTALSVALHLILLLLVSNAWWMGAHELRPVGSPRGSRIVTIYDLPQASPGKSQIRKPLIHTVRPRPTRTTAPVHVPDLPEATAPGSDQALGNGEVSITYLQGFPAEKPELAGTGPTGDIELDVQINEMGRIEQIHTRRGMTDTINRTIIAMVEQWIFHPAMRNGRPISTSERLHFHYDRTSATCGWECFSLAAQ